MGAPGVVVNRREGGSSALAVGWALFLLLAAGWTVLRMGSPVGLGVEALRGPARVFVGTVGIGTVLLWPLVRLSQRGGKGSGWRAAADAWAVSLPTAAAVAPLEALVHWGWGTTWLVVVCLGGWTWAAAGATALGTREVGAWRRAWWALVCVGMGGAGPGIALVAARLGVGARDVFAACSAGAGPVLISEWGVGDWTSWWGASAGWVVAGVLWAGVWGRTRVGRMS